MLSGKGLYLLSLLVLFFKNVLADDCSLFKSAASAFGGKIEETYSGVSDCCSATGITCDGAKHITGFKFDNFNAWSRNEDAGVEKLGNLEYLETIEFTNFKFTNKFPISFYKIKNLKKLIFKNSRYSSLPDEIGKIQNLEYLDLSNDDFSGNIPKSIGDLKNLNTLLLGGNSFDGTVPYEIKNLTNLKILKLNGSRSLNGYIPLKNIVTCDYSSTSVCVINDSCSTNSHVCSEQEIFDADNLNGNSEFKSGENDEKKEDTSSSSSSNTDDNSSNNNESDSFTKSDEDLFEETEDGFFKVFKIIFSIFAIIVVGVIATTIGMMICAIRYFGKYQHKLKHQRMEGIHSNTNSNSNEPNHPPYPPYPPSGSTSTPPITPSASANPSYVPTNVVASPYASSLTPTAPTAPIATPYMNNPAGYEKPPYGSTSTTVVNTPYIVTPVSSPYLPGTTSTSPVYPTSIAPASTLYAPNPSANPSYNPSEPPPAYSVTEKSSITNQNFGDSLPSPPPSAVPMAMPGKNL